MKSKLRYKCLPRKDLSCRNSKSILIFIILPLQNQVGRSAGYLVERLPTYRTGGVDTEIRGYTGLQMLYIETRTGLYVGREGMGVYCIIYHYSRGGWGKIRFSRGKIRILRRINIHVNVIGKNHCPLVGKDKHFRETLPTSGER